MRVLEDSKSSTGFDDPFTLHRARPKTMSFGNPFQAVGSKEFGETNAMDAFLDSMMEGDANKVSNALKRLAETASADYAPREKRGKRTNWFVENLNKDFTPKPDDDEDLEHNVLKKRLAQSKARQLATAKSKAKAKPLGSEAIQANITKQKATADALRARLVQAEAKQLATARSKAKAKPQRPEAASTEEPSFRELRKMQLKRRGAGKTLIHVPAPSMEYFDVKNDHYMMK